MGGFPCALAPGRARMETAFCNGRPRIATTATTLVATVTAPTESSSWSRSVEDHRWGLRALLGYDRQLCSEVLGAFAGEVIRSLKWRAKRALGLSSIQDAHTGTVTVVQRFDSSMRLNVHFHLLALDGVYVRQQDGALVWHSLATPTRAEVQDVAARTARCIQGILRAHGRSVHPALQTSMTTTCIAAPIPTCRPDGQTMLSGPWNVSATN
jgi:hypothetical protein